MAEHPISADINAQTSLSTLDSPSSFPPKPCPSTRPLPHLLPYPSASLRPHSWTNGLASCQSSQLRSLPVILHPAHIWAIDFLKLLKMHICHIQLRTNVGHLLFPNKLRSYCSSWHLPPRDRPCHHTHLSCASSFPLVLSRMELLPPVCPNLLLPEFWFLLVWVGVSTHDSHTIVGNRRLHSRIQSAPSLTN